MAHSHPKLHLGPIKRFFPECLCLQESSKNPLYSLLTLSLLAVLVYLSLCLIVRISVAFWFPRPSCYELAFIWLTSSLISMLRGKEDKDEGLYQMTTMTWYMGRGAQ